MEIHTEKRGQRWRDREGDVLIEDKRIDSADGRGVAEVFLYPEGEATTKGAWLDAAYLDAHGVAEVPAKTGGA